MSSGASPDPGSPRAVAAPSHLIAMPSPPPPAPPAAAEPDPRSPRAVATPSHLIAMPSPPLPAPPAAAPLVKKMKLRFAYAVACVFGGCVNRPSGMAVVGAHIGICIFYILTSSIDPEVWLPMSRVLLYLLLAFNVLQTCQWICYHMPVYGVYAMTDKPPKQQPAAAEVLLLPPPPPEMDMC